jgi:hypothetical protein
MQHGAGEIADVEQRKALAARSGTPGGDSGELLDERQGGGVAGAVDDRRAQDDPGVARQPTRIGWMMPLARIDCVSSSSRASSICSRG